MRKAERGKQNEQGVGDSDFRRMGLIEMQKSEQEW
jgi:hypothetical protein